ncbi:Ger(x)C family spore germination protein [Neobacillus sp. NPDC058068]|uniref:Ger(x)C family spore germination protein n=1 Tax=Neobacillus sp. NPDC058068 TaxID=3346325 RepID=UPI0036D93C92
MRKSFITALIIVMCLPVLSACWNQKELTDLAFVMALGIDRGKDNKFNVSFQIVIPGNVSLMQGGGAGQGLPIAIYSSTGDTLTEAARSVTKKVSRRLYYAHTNLIVFSEEIAKNGLLNIMDALDRDPEFRTTTQMVITRGTPAEVLVSSLANLDKLPVNKITKEIKVTEAMLGENMQINIDDFLAGLVSDGIEPVVNGFRVIGDIEMAGKAKDLQNTKTKAILAADGLAVFKKGKLIGWIEHENARGVVWILNKVKSTDVNINWNGKKKAISMATIRTKTKVSAKVNKGKPVIQIAIEDEGWISEANTDVDLTNPKEIEKIDKLIEKEIKKQILTTVKEAQKMKCDIFGFGERVHRKDPKLWKKIKANWDEQFAELEVNVKVDSYTRREGIRTNPYWKDLKQ